MSTACRVLLPVQVPVDLRVAVPAALADQTGGIELGHQVHIGVRPQLLGHKPQHRLGLGQHARHHQMPQQQPPAGQAVRVDHQRADLATHLLDGLSGHLRIVWAAQVAAGRRLTPDLEVGHVDVDDAVHELQAIQAVVGAGVVDDRQPQPAGDGQREGFQDLGDDVLGGDPVDVVTAPGLEGQHHLGQPRRGHPLPLDLPGDVVVLAEHTAQVAAGEEDRA
jgi:hypothetical protein